METSRQRRDRNAPGGFSFVKWPAGGSLGIPNTSVLVDKFAKANPHFVANNNTRSRICQPVFPAFPLTSAMRYRSNRREPPSTILTTNISMLSRVYDNERLTRSSPWHVTESITTTTYLERSKKSRKHHSHRHSVSDSLPYVDPLYHSSGLAREVTYTSLRGRHTCWPLCPLSVHSCVQCYLDARQPQDDEWIIIRALDRAVFFLNRVTIYLESLLEVLEAILAFTETVRELRGDRMEESDSDDD